MNRRRFTTTQLFESLNGRHFARFGDLEDAVRELFAEHLADFPVSYDYRDALYSAEARGWLVPRDDGVVVRTDKVPA